jgi:hypothetical protein
LFDFDNTEVRNHVVIFAKWAEGEVDIDPDPFATHDVIVTLLETYLTALAELDVEAALDTFHFNNEDDMAAYLAGELSIATWWPLWKASGVEVTATFKNYTRSSGSEAEETGLLIFDHEYTGIFFGIDMSTASVIDDEAIMNFVNVDGEWFISPLIP